MSIPDSRFPIPDFPIEASGFTLSSTPRSLAGQTLGVTCMQAALRSTPTGIVLAIIAITPIVVIPFACLFEGERPSGRSLLGAIIAIGGVIVLVLWP